MPRGNPHEIHPNSNLQTTVGKLMNRIGIIRNRAKDVWHVQGFERLGFDPCPAIIHYRYNTDYPTRLEAVAQASVLRKIKPHIQADWYRI